MEYEQHGAGTQAGALTHLALVAFLWADANEVEPGREWQVSLPPFDLTARVTYEEPDIWCAATRLTGTDTPVVCMDVGPIAALAALYRKL